MNGCLLVLIALLIFAGAFLGVSWLMAIGVGVSLLRGVFIVILVAAIASFVK